MSDHRILVTAAGGHLGRLTIDALLKLVPASQIVAGLRDPAKGADLAARGVTVVAADYSKPETLDAAFKGIDRLLLISSNELGQRVAQHRNVIDAAKRAGVKLIAYTSVLRADTSPLSVAKEHLPTEELIRASGIPFALLRNGWYTENYTASIPAALAHNALISSAGDGRIASASRADYAAAAAAVLTSAADHAGKVYELAGDSAYTLEQFAAEITKQSGKTVAYVRLPEADFKAALLGAGLPPELAELIATSDTAAANGALFDDSRTLGKLIGRPTTPFATTIAEALKA
ncbi:NAD(P)H dehydrogenase (quinone) [Bradyrhizobium sp. NFR13]|uniref:SDR family oxidoreductase n=1 Tax=Bradyrhizobium sp. NFR13 TaxID=1566285 RepID=UPI0008EDFF3F|nr:SDR family oxidoreductase [Bradyrhizobium sp. NFR13]SFL38631.1 NAD(P)H dehydrogenase (quinone) [Bradyrhizobium sp. NFR13]